MYEVICNLTLRVKGVTRAFPVGSVISLPEKAAEMLMRQGKIELVGGNPVPEPEDERFSNAFSRVVGAMSREYRPGFFDRARRQRPGRYSRFVVCENRVSEYWDVGDFGGFERELTEWGDIYKSLLALFRSGNHG